MAKLHVFCLALDGGQDSVGIVGIHVESYWFLDHLRIELQKEYAHYREAPRSEIKVWVLERYLDEGHLSPFNPETATMYKDVPITKIEADARRPIVSYFPNKIEANDVGKIHLIAKLGQISPSNSAQYGLSNVLSGPADHASKHLLSDTMGEMSGNTGPSSKRARLSINNQSTTFQDLKAFHDAYWAIPLDPSLTTLPISDLDGPELDNEDGLSSDILPGEPFLNVFGASLLVRAEYLRVFDMVKKVYDESRETHLAVVTGQPGIGKTFWIYYALRRCLGEKQPVIWCYCGELYCFSDSEDGVEIFDPVHGLRSPYMWWFVDAADVDSLPTMAYHPISKFFPIYVTSPKQERWETLHKLRLPTLVVMDPWTRAELEKAAKRLYPHRELNDMFERFDNAGPSVRHCLEFSPANIRQFYAKREKAITLDTTQGMLSALLDGKGGLRIGDICVVRRSDSESCEYIVGPISGFIRRRLLTQLWKWEEKDRVDMIKHFSRVPGAGGMVGLIFESQYQQQFVKKIAIHAKPMFRSNNTRSCWHAAFGDFLATPMLGKAQEEALNAGHPPISLSIVPSHPRAYGHTEPKIVIEENIYYVPLAANQVAIDSFIVHAGHLYMFQFASGSQHSVNHGLVAILAQFSNLPPAENQHYIFVVPKDCTKFSCQHSGDGFLADHVPYVAQMG